MDESVNFQDTCIILHSKREKTEIFNALEEGLRKGEYNTADSNLYFLLNFDWPICQTKIYKYEKMKKWKNEKMPRNN